MLFVVEKYKNNELSKEKLFERFQGWNAYTKWADSFKTSKMLFEYPVCFNSQKAKAFLIASEIIDF